MKKSIFKIFRIVCKVFFYLLIGFMIFLYFNPSLIRNCIIEKEFIRRLGKILPALIAVAGVYATVANNRRGTYKEIVTRERIEWLHKMQEALAEFLALTSRNDLTNGDNDKLDRARELYYLIISNLNVKEDRDKDKAGVKKLYYLIISNLNVKEEDGKENERDAVELLYKYANSKGLDVELNFVKDEDSEENKDSKDTKSIDELRKEKEKLIEEIKTLEDKIKNLRKTGEVDPLAGLKRKEIISKYTEIFNKTWNRIKKEAD